MTAPKILVVDNEPIVLSLLTRLATSAGYETVGAASAAVAWDHMRESGDHNFAGFVLSGLTGKGVELAREIRARGFKGSIVCMTSDTDTRAAMMAPGLCTHHGTKPISIDAFTSLLHAAVPLPKTDVITGGLPPAPPVDAKDICT